jgi:hypothetical protein
MFNTPILFLIFNRPKTTCKVFEQIRKIKPTHLYVAADGPRKDKPEEKALCEETRKLVLSNIDWECDVKILFRDENIGCGKAVAEAITWFFKNVEEGIILEDDTLPDITFFRFCEIQLNRYANTPEIKIISGNNFQNEISRGEGSYYFTKYIHVWGWATWRRTWLLYDFDLQDWICRSDIKRRELFATEKEIDYWKNIFDLVAGKVVDTWDYQLYYLSLRSKGINVVPNRNLVINIGFGQDSTHTKDPNHKLAKLNKYAYDEDIMPLKSEADTEADSFIFDNVFCEIARHNTHRKSTYPLLYRIFKKPVDIFNDIVKRKGNER